MTLQSSGQIQMSQVNNEFSRASTQQTAFSQLYRGGPIIGSFNTNVPTGGQISMSNFYGARKLFAFAIIITADTNKFNLYNQLLARGWDGSTTVSGYVQISSGIVVYSDSVGAPAFDIGGYMPDISSINVMNYGYIIGMGGRGGNGQMQSVVNDAKVGPIYTPTTNQSSGEAGGTGFAGRNGAIISLQNYGVVAGGGGGGGGSASPNQVSSPSGGGGQSGSSYSATGYNGWGNPGTFTGGGPGVAVSQHGNSGSGGPWGAAGGIGFAWPGDYQVTNGGAGGIGILTNGTVSLSPSGDVRGQIV